KPGGVQLVDLPRRFPPAGVPRHFWGPHNRQRVLSGTRDLIVAVEAVGAPANNQSPGSVGAPCQTVVVTGVTNILERAEIHHTGSRCPNKSVNNFVPGDCGVPHNHSRVGNRHAHHGICSIPAQGTKVEPLPCLWAEERNSDWSGIAAGDVTSSHEDTRLVNAP